VKGKCCDKYLVQRETGNECIMDQPVLVGIAAWWRMIKWLRFVCINIIITIIIPHYAYLVRYCSMYLDWYRSSSGFFSKHQEICEPTAAWSP
jgi:hypothetical protein